MKSTNDLQPASSRIPATFSQALEELHHQNEEVRHTDLGQEIGPPHPTPPPKKKEQMAMSSWLPFEQKKEKTENPQKQTTVQAVLSNMVEGFGRWENERWTEHMNVCPTLFNFGLSPCLPQV